MKDNYDFQWRLTFRFPLATALLLRLISKKNMDVGHRPFFFYQHALILFDAEAVYISNTIKKTLGPLLLLLFRSPEETANVSTDVALKTPISPRLTISGRRCWRPLGHHNQTGDGVKICIIDSGIDELMETCAPVTKAISFIDIAPRKDFFGHGTMAATVISGWKKDGSEHHLRAGKSTLFSAKIYGSDNRNNSIPTSLIEIAVAWGIEKGANILVACLGVPRIVDSLPRSFCSGITNILSRHPKVVMFGSAGIGEDAFPGSFATMEPSAAALVFPVAGWQPISCRHHKYGATADSYSNIVFSGPSALLPSAYIQYDSDGKNPTYTESDMDGASGACAYVSGIAALYYEKHIGYRGSDFRNNILVQMATNSWKCSSARCSWRSQRSGFGIPNPL